MPLAVGDHLDRYLITAHLGAGGLGEVYRARDSRLQRDVALKVLRAEADASDGEDTTRALLREAQATAALEHPNIVAVYDVVQAQAPEGLRGTPYLTMELVEGKPLRAFVGDPAVPVATRIGWLLGVARALMAAHARGIVHRDIKPSNVVVRSDGVAKVLDFGIAKRVRIAAGPETVTEDGAPGSTNEGHFAGTPAYMAPEQLTGSVIDARCDQFSWGVMAYELLSGQRPWEHPSDSVHLVAEILTSEPPQLVGRQPGIPEHVADVVMRALSKAPERRFASFAELVDALDPAASLSVGSAPIRAGGRWRWPVAAALVASLGVVALRSAPSRRVVPLASEIDSGAAVPLASASAPANEVAGTASAAAVMSMPDAGAPRGKARGSATRATTAGGRSPPPPRGVPSDGTGQPLYFPK